MCYSKWVYRLEMRPRFCGSDLQAFSNIVKLGDFVSEGALL